VPDQIPSVLDLPDDRARMGLARPFDHRSGRGRGERGSAAEPPTISWTHR